MEVLFKTRHGSRLYNLAHEDSDDDFYVVVDKVQTNKKKFAQQTIVDNVDTTVVDLGTFLNMCSMGVPQACEAAMSAHAEIDKIGALRAGMVLGPQTWDRYLRTIKSFALDGDFKHKRHALRLALNLHDIMHYGGFNPSLDKDQVDFINKVAAVGSSTFVYDYALDIAWEGLIQ